MRKDRAMEEDRGRRARKPREIPKKGWRDILVRVSQEQKKDNLSIVAAGVAFYALLAIFPALAALISIYGLVADPAQLEQQLQSLGQVLPPNAYEVIGQQLHAIVTSSGGALGLGVIAGILLSLWSAAKGMKAMITALNITYEEKERRGFVKLNGVALLLTLGAIVFVLFSLGLIVVLPALLDRLPLPELLQGVLSFARWPLLGLLVIAALALLYRYAPSRDQPQWKWVSWGAVAATGLWLVLSALFSFYVSNFGNYNETYGSVGAVVILLLWFFLTAYMVLLGAEMNAEMEHQTRHDTTRGEPRRMGERDARMADTVARKP
ncbi:MAG: YihY/virulence factor BrkB family protein [Desulfuromonadales bacterium]|nr:YihY/virulence factor BrkB family protein [Desulfuromonadales bacterium]